MIVYASSTYVSTAGFDEVDQTVNDTRITVGISVYVSNASAVIGQEYDVNVAVELSETNEEIFAATMNVTVVDDIAAEGVVSTIVIWSCMNSQAYFDYTETYEYNDYKLIVMPLPCRHPTRPSP